MYTKLVLQEEEEGKEGDEDEENTEPVEVPPPKKAKVTMSVLCVENGVLGGGPKRGRSPKSMYMTEFVACFFRRQLKAMKVSSREGGVQNRKRGTQMMNNACQLEGYVCLSLLTCLVVSECV